MPKRPVDPGVLQLQSLLNNPGFATVLTQRLLTTTNGVPAQVGNNAPHTRLARDVKIAEHLSALYALDAGLSAIMDRTHASPVEILSAIQQGGVSGEDTLLLARFARATWLAAQPFGASASAGISPIKATTLLGEADISQDSARVKLVASLVLAQMKDVQTGSIHAQLEKLRALLQDPAFARDAAQQLDAATSSAAGGAMLEAPDDTRTVDVDVNHEFTATALGSLYALEAGATALADRNRVTPLMVIESARNGLLAPQDALLLTRFINATWKTGQVFQGLDRIHKSDFKPAASLDDGEVASDLARVRAVAGIVMDALK